MAPQNISATAQKELDGIAKLFDLSDQRLVQITEAFGKAFRHGLEVPDQPIVMGPSFVTGKPDGTEKGTFFTLEIHWNSLICSKIDLHHEKRKLSPVSKTFEISKDMMKADVNVFFDFLATSFGTFLKEKSFQDLNLPLGFTFPFGIQKSSPGHAKLISWSKGFSIPDAVGKDIVQLLQDALDRANLGIRCVALVNDSVTTLLSETYLSSPCIMSALYGAGANGGYYETGSAIKKLPQFHGDVMAINTEWGAFSQRELLNINVFDEEINRTSANPGRYLFQKMCSWFYIGEIFRLALLSMVDRGLLFSSVSTETLKKQHGFTTLHLFKVEDANGIDGVKEVLSDVLGCSKDAVSDQDAELTRLISTLVATRSAKLASCPLAAMLTHLGYASLEGSAQITGGKIPIVATGEFFIGSAQFESRLKQNVASLLGGTDFQKRLDFHVVEPNGTIGAALAAFYATNK